MNDTVPVALVTGSARRLGHSITSALANIGYVMAIHYHSSEPEAARLAEEIVTINGEGYADIFKADLADSDACKRLPAEVVNRFGRLDLLVNNASIFRKTPLEDITPADIEKFHSTNLLAPAILSLSAARFLRQARPGRIINMLDIFAYYPRKGFLPYTISKAGLAGLTRQMAVELAPDILVNAVAPGAILAPEDGLEEKVRVAMTRRIPLKRFGSPRDIANAVAYLAQCDYVTGQTIVVDGGRCLNI